MTALEAPAAPSRGTADDLYHLRLLSIFHYVVAGITALASLLPGIWLILGLLMATGRLAADDEGAHVVGWIMAGCGSFLVVLGLCFAALVARAGRALAGLRSYSFCLVVAALLCLSVPFGTVLGVLTIVVLGKSSVRALFERAAGATSAPPAGHAE